MASASIAAAYPLVLSVLCSDSAVKTCTSGYAAAIDALAGWVGTGEKPSPAGVAAACPGFDATYGTGCFVDPSYTPAPYADRVEARPGGHRWPTMSAAQEAAWARLPGIGIEP